MEQVKGINGVQNMAITKSPVWLVISVMILLAGCDNATQNSELDSEQSSLDQSILLWNTSKIASYQYTYKRECYCMPEQDIVVAVTSGDVSEAFYTPGGSYLADEDLDSLYTIENMFELIQEAIDLNVAVLEVDYNQETGHPEEIYIDRNKNLADEEITYIVKEFQ